MGRKPSLASQRVGRIDEVIFTARSGGVTHPKTGKAMEPKGLGDQVVPVPAGVDPRTKLADWMADPKNPFFSKAIANRIWAHFMGVGLVEAVDDMRVTNPPSNPQLLVALADALVRAKRPADAVRNYRRAAALAPHLPGLAAKLSDAESQLASERTPVPARRTRYSNAAPETQSH